MVVFEKQRVVGCNDAASSTGIQPGQSSATVQGLLASEAPLLLERDVIAEQNTLQQLANWAYSVTPTLEVWYDDSLQLEIGSCLQLHGELDQIIKRLHQAMTRRGLTPAVGVASNRPAAWLLSHSQGDLAQNPAIPLPERLGPLPIELSQHNGGATFAAAVARLHKAGITRFEQLLSLPASAIGKRCGQTFAQWLGQISATSDEVHHDFQPPPYFYDALWFGFEVRHCAELEPAMAQLLGSFCAFLRTTQLSTQNIEWQLLRTRGSPQCVQIRSSEANSDTAHWLNLSYLHLEHLTIAEDVEGLALKVENLYAGKAIPDDLFKLNRSNEPLHNLPDRLRSRLGLLAVNQLALRDAHVPEHRQLITTETSATWSKSPNNTIDEPSQAQRPFWLFDQPQPVHQEGDRLEWQGPLELIYGPERIEDNWWQQPISRDYYIARDHEGQPLWLFQDRRSRRWYVHGVLP